MASQVDYIAKVLQDEFLWVNKEIDFEVNVSKIISQEPYQSLLQEVYEDLEGEGEKFPVTYSKPDFQCEDAYIIFHDSLTFNKYRNLTLRSEFYDEFEGFSMQNYRRFCRANESKCLSAGSAGGLWTNAEAEHYFGKSQDRGDLGLSGSAQWKKHAFEQFLFDVVAKVENKKVVYISIYDVIMINGQLTPIEKLTLSQNAQSAKYLWNYLKRLLGR